MSFTRKDYEHLVSMSRRMMALGRTGGQTKTQKREIKNMARDLFAMCETVIGQQIPPIEQEQGFK